MTNRDLYLAVGRIIKANRESSRSLEMYLRALRQLGISRHTQDAIAGEEFAAFLGDAFVIEPAHDGAWSEEEALAAGGQPESAAEFTGWLVAITSQIVDLREMDEAGQLADKMRYFGIDSPRGHRWFNFDPCGYLECAMEGSVGGWEPEDESGRTFVPGEVAALDENGQLVTMQPEDVPRPVYEMGAVTWAMFGEVLWAGQCYE
jgi:hypothetical protein